MHHNDFNDYQSKANLSAKYPKILDNLLYPALKLNGEAGEVAEKVGKLMRDKGYWPGEGKEISNEDRHALLLELGDVLWYVAAIATELSTNLEDVATMNLKKLDDRMNRDMISGSGDTR